MDENIWYIVNVEAAIYKNDEWLIIKRSSQEAHAGGLFSLVGGKVENVTIENHVLENTLKREILEEVGITIFDEMTYLESKAFVSDDHKTVVDIVFMCEYRDGVPKVMNQDEVEAVYWMSALDIMNQEDAPDYLVESIKKAEIIRKEKRNR